MKKKIRGVKPKVWRGYRNCSRCTRWRPVSDYPVRKSRSPTGRDQIQSVCNECKRRQGREHYDKLSDDEKRAKGVKANQQAQKRRDRYLSGIEQQAEELAKLEAKIEKMREKMAATRAAIRTPRKSIAGQSTVDIIPFRMWLLRKNRESGYNTSELAFRMGQDEARVRRWLDGYQWNGAGRDPSPIRVITIGVVDEIAIALDDPGLLDRLYPLESEDVESLLE